jgi:hypothetical protein
MAQNPRSGGRGESVLIPQNRILSGEINADSSLEIASREGGGLSFFPVVGIISILNLNKMIFLRRGSKENTHMNGRGASFIQIMINYYSSSAAELYFFSHYNIIE